MARCYTAGERHQGKLSYKTLEEKKINMSSMVGAYKTNIYYPKRKEFSLELRCEVLPV